MTGRTKDRLEYFAVYATACVFVLFAAVLAAGLGWSTAAGEISGENARPGVYKNTLAAYNSAVNQKEI